MHWNGHFALGCFARKGRRARMQESRLRLSRLRGGDCLSAGRAPPREARLPCGFSSPPRSCMNVEGSFALAYSASPRRGESGVIGNVGGRGNRQAGTDASLVDWCTSSTRSAMPRDALGRCCQRAAKSSATPGTRLAPVTSRPKGDPKIQPRGAPVSDNLPLDCSSVDALSMPDISDMRQPRQCRRTWAS